MSIFHPPIIQERRYVPYSAFNVQIHSSNITLEITRLRASKITFDAEVTPQAHPVSIKRCIAIRVAG
jgi:hypothetical protein